MADPKPKKEKTPKTPAKPLKTGSGATKTIMTCVGLVIAAGAVLLLWDGCDHAGAGNTSKKDVAASSKTTGHQTNILSYVESESAPRPPQVDLTTSRTIQVPPGRGLKDRVRVPIPVGYNIDCSTPLNKLMYVWGEGMIAPAETYGRPDEVLNIPGKTQYLEFASGTGQTEEVNIRFLPIQ